MITDGEKWHYLALKSKPTINGYNRSVRSLSKLPRGMSSNHVENYYCFSCFHSKSTDNTLKKLERLCGNHHYCHIVTPEEDKKY